MRPGHGGCGPRDVAAERLVGHRRERIGRRITDLPDKNSYPPPRAHVLDRTKHDPAPPELPGSPPNRDRAQGPPSLPRYLLVPSTSGDSVLPARSQAMLGTQVPPPRARGRLRQRSRRPALAFLLVLALVLIVPATGRAAPTPEAPASPAGEEATPEGPPSRGPKSLTGPGAAQARRIQSRPPVAGECRDGESSRKRREDAGSAVIKSLCVEFWSLSDQKSTRVLRTARRSAVASRPQRLSSADRSKPHRSSVIEIFSTSRLAICPVYRGDERGGSKSTRAVRTSVAKRRRPSTIVPWRSA